MIPSRSKGFRKRSSKRCGCKASATAIPIARNSVYKEILQKTNSHLQDEDVSAVRVGWGDKGRGRVPAYSVTVLWPDG